MANEIKDAWFDDGPTAKITPIPLLDAWSDESGTLTCSSIRPFRPAFPLFRLYHLD